MLRLDAYDLGGKPFCQAGSFMGKSIYIERSKV
jgi:hypothetical protein